MKNCFLCSYVQSLADFNAKTLWEEIDPDVYDTPIFHKNIKSVNFVLFDVKLVFRQSIFYKYVCLINEVEEEGG